MSKFITAALLLTSFSWSSWSIVVSVKPGEDAVLPCRKVKEEMFWASLLDDQNYTCIAATTTTALMCQGMKKDGRFEINVSSSFVNLTIKRVKMADRGFYFCVFNFFNSGDVNVVQLNVEDVENDKVQDPKENTGCDDVENHNMQDPKENTGCDDTFVLWISLILGGLCVLLILVIVGFALKIKKIQSAQSQEANGSSKDEVTEELNYAAVNFRPKARHKRRALDIDPNVIYAATR